MKRLVYLISALSLALLAAAPSFASERRPLVNNGGQPTQAQASDEIKVPGAIKVVDPTLTGSTTPARRAPVFIWQNPNGSTAAGYNSALQVWVGDNPTLTPGLGDSVAITTNINNGNNRFAIWGENILAGRCGAAEGCGAGYIDGPTVGSEIDVYSSLSYTPANRAFNPSGGTYVVEGQQIYCQGPQYCTAGMSIWSTLSNGSNWWREGISMNRIANIGLHFDKTAGDTGTQLSVAAIQDDSNSANVLQIGSGTHTNYVNAPNWVTTSSGNTRFGNQGEAIGVTNYLVVGGSTGTTGIELNRGGGLGLYCTTDGTSYGQCLTGINVPLNFGVNNAVKMTIQTTGIVTLSDALQITKRTVASLTGAITCNAGNEGVLAAVTDANSATFNAALAGGGANHVLAYCNGTGWTVH